MLLVTHCRPLAVHSPTVDWLSSRYKPVALPASGYGVGRSLLQLGGNGALGKLSKGRQYRRQQPGGGLAVLAITGEQRQEEVAAAVESSSSGSGRNLVVAVDGSPDSQYACRWLLENVYRPGDVVHVAHCIPYFPPTPGIFSLEDGRLAMVDVDRLVAEEEQYIRTAEKRVADWCSEAFEQKGSQVAYVIDILRENPLTFGDRSEIGAAICQKAHELAAAAVVVASHEHSALSELLQGSVTDHCSHYCAEPLLVLHAPSPRAQEAAAAAKGAAAAGGGEAGGEGGGQSPGGGVLRRLTSVVGGLLGGRGAHQTEAHAAAAAASEAAEAAAPEAEAAAEVQTAEAEQSDKAPALKTLEPIFSSENSESETPFPLPSGHNGSSLSSGEEEEEEEGTAAEGGVAVAPPGAVPGDRLVSSADLPAEDEGENLIGQPADLLPRGAGALLGLGSSGVGGGGDSSEGEEGGEGGAAKAGVGGAAKEGEGAAGAAAEAAGVKEEPSWAQRHIVLAVDDSDASQRACEWAARHLYRPGDLFHVLHIIPVLPYRASYGTAALDGVAVMLPVPGEDWQAATEQYVSRRFVPLLEAAGVRYQADIVLEQAEDSIHGVGQAICHRAEELGAAAVVLGSHTRGRLAEFLLGSLATFMTHHCVRPVAVLH